METIKNYLDHVFRALPQTQEVLDLKQELLANMEDKYDELKSLGKTENEAIGIVISGFGNIDELLQEMNIDVIPEIDTSSNQADTPILSIDEVREYITARRASMRCISLGVTLVLLGVIALITCTVLIEAGFIFNYFSMAAQDVVAVIILFLFIAFGVAFLIFSSLQLQPFKFIEEGKFEMDVSVQSILSSEYSTLNTKKSIGIIVGVALCILSPIPVLLGSLMSEPFTTLSVCILLLMITIAVNIFILTNGDLETYKKLLKLEEFKAKKKQGNKVIDAVEAIVWPLAVVIFLVSGLVFNLWHINWIIFVITGILFGAFRAFYSIISDE